MLPVLYSFRRCPYAMRARMGLVHAGIRCELREVVLRSKPPELIAISPKATVPVLQLPGGEVIDESLEIMRWALAQHDPAQWLVPDGDSLAGALELVAQAEARFKPHLDRYKYPDRYPGTDPMAHRTEACTFIATLETRLTRNAHLCGARVSLADIAIFPFVRQFAHTDSDWFTATPYRATQAWLADLTGSELFAAVMQKYSPWQNGADAVYFPA